MSANVPDRKPAPEDGIQVVGESRFRAIRGELMLPGAVFEPFAVTQAAHEAYVADAAAKAAPTAPVVAPVAETGPTEATVATGPTETTATKAPEKKS
jgi:hypothetical protein